MADEPDAQRQRAGSEVCIKSASGTVVRCSKEAASLSGTLREWMKLYSSGQQDSYEQIFPLKTGAAGRLR